MAESYAIRLFKRRGVILPEHYGEVAAWIGEQNGDDESQPTVETDPKQIDATVVGD